MSKTLRTDPNYPTLVRWKMDIKRHDELLKFFIELNTQVMPELFFGSVLEEDSVSKRQLNKYSNNKVEKVPLFLGQLGLLYKYNPTKYEGMITDHFLNFLGKHFRRNIIAIVNKEGYLLYFLLMQVSKPEKIMISRYANEHLIELPKYQYHTSEYSPELEVFKLLNAVPKELEKAEDIVITYF